MCDVAMLALHIITFDRSTDPITKQKVKVQTHHIIAHAQYVSGDKRKFLQEGCLM